MEEPPHKSSPMPPVGVVQRPLLEVCAGAGAAVPLIPPLTYSQIIVSCKSAKELYKLHGWFGRFGHIHIVCQIAKRLWSTRSSQSVIQSVSRWIEVWNSKEIALLFADWNQFGVRMRFSYLPDLKIFQSSGFSKTFRFKSSLDWAVLCIWLGLSNNRWGGAFCPSKVNGDQRFGQLRLWFRLAWLGGKCRAMKWQMLDGWVISG